MSKVIIKSKCPLSRIYGLVDQLVSARVFNRELFGSRVIIGFERRMKMLREWSLGLGLGIIVYEDVVLY